MKSPLNLFIVGNSISIISFTLLVNSVTLFLATDLEQEVICVILPALINDCAESCNPCTSTTRNAPSNEKLPGPSNLGS